MGGKQVLGRLARAVGMVHKRGDNLNFVLVALKVTDVRMNRKVEWMDARHLSAHSKLPCSSCTFQVYPVSQTATILSKRWVLLPLPGLSLVRKSYRRVDGVGGQNLKVSRWRGIGSRSLPLIPPFLSLPPGRGLYLTAFRTEEHPSLRVLIYLRICVVSTLIICCASTSISTE